MECYFNQFGDHIPNSDGEIHLDPVDKFDIYDEYVRDVSALYTDDSVIGYPKFLETWATCFPFVSIREYKQVTGKCMTCALVSGLRWACMDHKRRAMLSELHALHRSMYMNERLAYYDRIHEALSNPSEVMSCISGGLICANNWMFRLISCLTCLSDGMAQNHCALPHLANQKDFSDKLPQHLQGVLEHGQLLKIYRTFHTVSNGANLQIYVLLCKLEDFYRRWKKFPKKLYWQVS